MLIEKLEENLYSSPVWRFVPNEGGSTAAFYEEGWFHPMGFCLKMAQCCSMSGVKTQLMDIGQRSSKSFRGHSIHKMH